MRFERIWEVSLRVKKQSLSCQIDMFFRADMGLMAAAARFGTIFPRDPSPFDGILSHHHFLVDLARTVAGLTTHVFLLVSLFLGIVSCRMARQTFCFVLLPAEMREGVSCHRGPSPHINVLLIEPFMAFDA